MNGGFVVHPATLHQSAEKTTKVGENVHGSSDLLKGVTPQAISAHLGWGSSGALQQCLAAWEERLPALATEVQQIGTNLQQTVTQYETADQRTAELLRHLASELDGGTG